MRHAVKFAETGTRAISYLLGAAVIIMFAAVLVTEVDVVGIASWAHQVFGYGFIVLLGSLILTALFCWVKCQQDSADYHVWLEAGLQAANGVTTLALTFTLLGISLGIGVLAEQPLTPETVQEVIRGLTENFSLAFMTTVVGLPISAVLRTILKVSHAKHVQRTALPAPAPASGISGETGETGDVAPR